MFQPLTSSNFRRKDELVLMLISMIRKICTTAVGKGCSPSNSKQIRGIGKVDVNFMYAEGVCNKVTRVPRINAALGCVS